MFYSLQQAPLWVMIIILGLIFIGALELTFRIHQHCCKTKADNKIEAVGHLLSAVLGLLALLLGFTFSMALERYDSRLVLVRAESNAISTAYLQVQILDEPYRNQLNSLFKKYVNTRLDYFTHENLSAYKGTLAVEDAMWPIMTQAVHAMDNHDYTSVVVSSMNAMFDMAASRRAAIAAKIPTSVFEMIIWYAVISSITIGYTLSATNQRHFLLSSIVLFLVAFVIALIMDLDRPLHGTIHVSYEPLKLVAEQINR